MPSTKPQIIIRATPEEKQAWETAAQRDGRSLGGWIGKAADEKMRRDGKAKSK